MVQVVPVSGPGTWGQRSVSGTTEHSVVDAGGSANTRNTTQLISETGGRCTTPFRGLRSDFLLQKSHTSSQHRPCGHWDSSVRSLGPGQWGSHQCQARGTNSIYLLVSTVEEEPVAMGTWERKDQPEKLVTTRESSGMTGGTLGCDMISGK